MSEATKNTSQKTLPRLKLLSKVTKIKVSLARSESTEQSSPKQSSIFDPRGVRVARFVRSGSSVSKLDLNSLSSRKLNSLTEDSRISTDEETPATAKLESYIVRAKIANGGFNSAREYFEGAQYQKLSESTHATTDQTRVKLSPTKMLLKTSKQLTEFTNLPVLKGSILPKQSPTASPATEAVSSVVMPALSGSWLTPKLSPPTNARRYYMSNLWRALGHRRRTFPPAEFKCYLSHVAQNYKSISSMREDSLPNISEVERLVKLRSTLRDVNVSVGRRLAPFKPLLVLDLDETLIHSPQNQQEDCQCVQRIYTDNNKTPARIVKFHLRPHLAEFLQAVSEVFDIYVFTASSAAYAQAVLASVDPIRRYIKRVFDRRFCMATKKGYLVKDLRILRDDCDLDRILIVDNLSYCFYPQLKNGVPIIPFEGDSADRELLDLKDYLLDLAGSPSSMVQQNSEHFGLQKYSQGSEDSLFRRLFGY